MPDLPEEPADLSSGLSRRDADRRQRNSAITFVDRRAGERRSGKDRRTAPRA